MLYYEYQTDMFVEWNGEPINDVCHPRNIEQVWSAGDLAAINLYVPVIADAIPSGKQIISTSVQRIEGVVKFVHVLEDIPPPTKQELKNYAANKRWQKETGGIVVGGSNIDTTRESQGLINGGFNLAKDNAEATIKFKTPSGVFVTLDADTMITIGRAVGNHVQSCFSLESDVNDSINSDVITTYEQIDTVFD